MQKTTNTWIEMIHAARMRSFANTAAFYLTFNRTWNNFEVFSREKAGFAPRMQANAFQEAYIPVQEEEDAPAEMWENSAAVDEDLQYVACLLL